MKKSNISEVKKIRKLLLETANDLITMFDDKTCNCGANIHCLDDGYEYGECNCCKAHALIFKNR